MMIIEYQDGEKDATRHHEHDAIEVRPWYVSEELPHKNKKKKRKSPQKRQRLVTEKIKRTTFIIID